MDLLLSHLVLQVYYNCFIKFRGFKFRGWQINRENSEIYVPRKFVRIRYRQYKTWYVAFLSHHLKWLSYTAIGASAKGPKQAVSVYCCQTAPTTANYHNNIHCEKPFIHCLFWFHKKLYTLLVLQNKCLVIMTRQMQLCVVILRKCKEIDQFLRYFDRLCNGHCNSCPI